MDCRSKTDLDYIPESPDMTFIPETPDMTFVPETPNKTILRSRRQSTILSSKATKSALRQTGAKDNVTTVADTPEAGDNSILDKSPNNSPVIKRSSREHPRYGGRITLPSQLPGEETWVAQGEGRSAFSSTGVLDVSLEMDVTRGSMMQKRALMSAEVFDVGGEKILEMEVNRVREGTRQKRDSSQSSDVSGVTRFETDVSKSCKRQKRDRRRSDLPTMDEYVAFIQSRTSSPKRPPLPSPVEDFTNGSHDDFSSDEEIDWTRIKSNVGSVDKYLPRKSVVISGNVKSKTKKMLNLKNKKKITRKNLDKELSINNEEGNNSMDKTDTILRREILGRSICKSSEANLTSSSADKSGLCGVSYQNFSTDSAKASLAAIQAGQEVENMSSSVPRRVNLATSMEITPSVSRKCDGDIKEKTSLTPQSMVMCDSPVIKRKSPSSTGPTRLETTPGDDSVFKAPFSCGSSEDSCCATQPPPILDGVVVWVEYRSEGANLSSLMQSLARELGARVETKLTREVTHVIFKDGSQAMFKKAKNLGLHILAARWLEESKKAGMKVAESDYPSVSLEKYSKPGLFPKIKKMRSMQPKTLEEDFDKASKSYDRRQKMLDKKRKIEDPPDKSILSANIDSIIKGKPQHDTTLNKVLAQFDSPTGAPQKLIRKSNLPPSPTSPSEKDYDTPLAERLAKRFHASPAATPSPVGLLTSRRSCLASTNKTNSNQSLHNNPDKINKETIGLETTTDSELGNNKDKEGDHRNEVEDRKSLALSAESEKSSLNYQVKNVRILLKRQTKSPMGYPAMESTRLNISIPPIQSLTGLTVGKPVLESTRMSSRSDTLACSLRAASKEQNQSIRDSEQGNSTIFSTTSESVKSSRNDNTLVNESLINTSQVRKSRKNNLGPPTMESTRVDVPLTLGLPESESTRIQSSMGLPVKELNKIQSSLGLPVTESTRIQYSFGPPIIESTRIQFSMGQPETESTRIEDALGLPVTESTRIQSFFNTHLQNGANVTSFKDIQTSDNLETTHIHLNADLSNSKKRHVMNDIDTAINAHKKSNSLISSETQRSSTKSPSVSTSKSRSVTATTSPSRSPRVSGRFCQTASKDQNSNDETIVHDDRCDKSDEEHRIKRSKKRGKGKTKESPIKRNVSRTKSTDCSENQMNKEVGGQSTSQQSKLLQNSLSDNTTHQDHSMGGARKKHKLLSLNSLLAGVLNTTVDPSAPKPDTSKIVFEHVHIEKNCRISQRNESRSEDLVCVESVKKRPNKSNKKCPENRESKSRTKSQNGSQMKRSRRSTMEFEPLPSHMTHTADKSSADANFVDESQVEKGNTKTRRKKKSSSSDSDQSNNYSKVTCCLVLTSCHTDDKGMVKQLVKRLGRFRLDSGVTDGTSHVVSGEGKRTMSVLKGLMRGCYILSIGWVLASLEVGHWVEEEPYELVDFSPAVRSVRQQREESGKRLKIHLFKEVGSVYISRQCRAPVGDLAQLVTLGGGSVAKLLRVANVVVGELAPHEEGTVDCVAEKWLLDSVQFQVIMPFSDYPIV